MKKENTMLKKALEEAAKIELEALPEEKQIIRPYSDKFQKEMNTLIGKEDTAVIRKRPRVKFAALIAAVLIVVMSVGTAFANDVIRIGGSEMRETLQENMNKADYSEDIQAFDEAVAKADDYLTKLTRDTECADPLLVDYSEAYELDITVEKDGYRFYLDKIIKGQYKRNICVSGNPFKADAVFEWVIEEGYFMLAEITRADGAKWDVEEDSLFELSTVVAGYNPWSSRSCLRGRYGMSELEENGWIYIVDVTEAMMFAKHDLGLVVEEHPYSGDLMSYEYSYIDENGLPAFRDHVEGTNLVIKFNVDNSFADEKAAEAYVEEYGLNIGLDHYRK